MKFGVADYGMSVWYGGNPDFLGRLEDLKSLGYDGTERLECIGAEDAVNRAVAYRRMGMDFATCRSLTPESGIQLTAALGKEYVWLTVNASSRTSPMDVFFRQALAFTSACGRYGVRAAVHNHLGQRVEKQEEIDAFLSACPDAFLLLDIGHLFGAGGDVLATIDRWHDRIAAVHFKDVFIQDASITDPARWLERLRFCELGGGNAGVPWKEAAELLKKYGYNGWVHVEHDTHLRDPLVDLKGSLEKLKNIFC